MSLQRQSEFGGGIFRAPRAPQGSVYDCVNGLVDDELAIYRRGGNVYKSSAAGGTLRTVVALPTYAGDRVLTWGFVPTVYMLGADDVTLEATDSGVAPAPLSRAVAVNGYVALRGATAVAFFGGSRKPVYSTGTVTVTAGSTAVTGAGTAWLANVEKGAILSQNGGGTMIGLVKSVNSNTSITLRDPAPTSYAAGTSYFAFQRDVRSIPAWPDALVALGTAGGRLLVGGDNRVYFTDPENPFSAVSTDYHEMPSNAMVVGIEGLGDSALVFTTAGVWLIENLALDLTDADGNPQQTLRQVAGGVVAWHDNGIVGMSQYAGLLGWRGQVVVPALDDVYMMGVGGDPVPISRGIRPRYRSYVEAGHSLGVAALYQGHYFLPVVTAAGTWIDTLVCRLDQRSSGGQLRPAWTRFTNTGAGVGYAGRARAGAAPDLLATHDQRITDDTGIFIPTAANKNDADGVTHDLDVTTNDFEPSSRSTLQRVRLDYELVDAASDNPTISASYAVDAEEGAALTGLSGAAPEGTPDKPFAWKVNQRGRRFRLRFLSSGPAAKLRLRAVDWFVRDSNRP